MDPFWGPFILYCEQVENPRRGFAKFDSCTKCEEANFALDTSEASASPKGLTATLRKQGILRANKPFSRSKIKDQVEGLVFYFTVPNNNPGEYREQLRQLLILQQEHFGRQQAPNQSRQLLRHTHLFQAYRQSSARESPPESKL